MRLQDIHLKDDSARDDEEEWSYSSDFESDSSNECHGDDEVVSRLLSNA